MRELRNASTSKTVHPGLKHLKEFPADEPLSTFRAKLFGTYPDIRAAIRKPSGKKPEKHVDNKANWRPFVLIAMLLFIPVLICQQVYSATHGQLTIQDIIDRTATARAKTPGTPTTPTVPGLQFGTVPGTTAQPTQTATPTPTITPTDTPSNTPTNTATPTDTPTPTNTPFIGVIWVSVRAIDPTKPANVKAGFDWQSVAGYGAGCPIDWPLGTQIVFEDGQRLLCVDRYDPAAACLDGICRVYVLGADQDWIAPRPAQVIDVQGTAIPARKVTVAATVTPFVVRR